MSRTSSPQSGPRHCGSEDEGGDNGNLADAEQAALDRCADLWNSGGDDGFNRSYVSSYDRGQPYVSVGFAADFPDKCLVTVAFPESGQAFQFFEGTEPIDGGNGYVYPADAGAGSPISALPESVKQWNADMNEEGLIALYGDELPAADDDVGSVDDVCPTAAPTC